MNVQYPIGELQMPSTVTQQDVNGWLEDIATYAMRLRAVVEGLSEEQLQKTYRQGAWTVRQLVHHIADSQLNMYQRLKLALTDDNPHVPAFHKNAWAVQPDTQLPVESSLKLLEGLNNRIVALGQTLTEKQLARYFTHQLNGQITVATKLAKLCWHEEHHLAHIHIALQQ